MLHLVSDTMCIYELLSDQKKMSPIQLRAVLFLYRNFQACRNAISSSSLPYFSLISWHLIVERRNF